MKNRTLILISLLGVSLIVPRSAMAVTRNAVWDMDGFWWLDDDASGLNVEDNTGYGAGDAAQETHITGVAKNTRLRLRVDISETNNQNQNQTLAPRIEYQSGNVTCTAGGTWTTITTSTTNAWALSDSTTITDKDVVDTDRVSGNSKAFGSGNGEFLDQSNPGTALDFANKSNEWEYSIVATSNAADSQIYTFRITNNGTALNNYNLPTAGDCPNATTAAAASSSFTQDNYRWYVNSANENVTDPWSSVTSVDIAENSPITVTPAQYDPPNSTQEIRLRMNFLVSTANLSASSTYFKLQFRTGTDSDCSAGSWTDAPDTGLGGEEAWEYTSLTDVTDGATLTVAKLTGTDVLESYVRSNPSAVNPNSATTTQDIEYDFHIIGTNASANTRYLFRAVETTSDGSGTTAFAGGYTNCAILTTEPDTSNLLRHGNLFSSGSERGFFWAN